MTQENSSGTQVVSTQSTKMPAQAKKNRCTENYA